MNRLGLVGRLGRHFMTPTKRTLYTDSIYPYPLKYVTEKLYPKTYNYRETWEDPPYQASDERLSIWMGRIFWTYLFWMFFHHPEDLFGHFHPPDPCDWTDEELGIPPLEEGPYEEWLARNKKSA